MTYSYIFSPKGATIVRGGDGSIQFAEPPGGKYCYWRTPLWGGGLTHNQIRLHNKIDLAIDLLFGQAT